MFLWLVDRLTLSSFLEPFDSLFWGFKSTTIPFRASLCLGHSPACHRLLDLIFFSAGSLAAVQIVLELNSLETIDCWERQKGTD